MRSDPEAILQVGIAAATKATFARIIDCPTYPIAKATPDLPTAVAQLRLLLTSDSSQFRAERLAELHSWTYSIETRKRSGQFFTPSGIAEYVLAAVPPLPNDHVCDAGSGLAIFAEVMLKRDLHVRSYLGVESDPLLALFAAHVLEASGAPPTFRIWYANFLAIDSGRLASHKLNSPTLIISNPPFVRFHKLKGRVRVQTHLEKSLGISVSPFSGSSTYFLAKAVELLGERNQTPPHINETQRVVFLLPSEAAGAAHSRLLRERLALLGWNAIDSTLPTTLAHTGLPRAGMLARLAILDRRRDPMPRRPHPAPYRLGDLLQIRRGISTGKNSFFVLSEAEIERRGLPKEVFKPVLPTRIPLRTYSFTATDWEWLRNEGHPCWLLTLPPRPVIELPAAVASYLKEGIREGLHLTPTASRLRVWYSLPVPPHPADLFVTYVFRHAPRFICNEARVLHLTNILGGRFLAKEKPVCDIGLIEELNAQAERWMQQGSVGRQYRDDLSKIEPKEMASLPLDTSIAEKFRLPLTGHVSDSLFENI